jgi:hypothetical protein
LLRRCRRGVRLHAPSDSECSGMDATSG